MTKAKWISKDFSTMKKVADFLSTLDIEISRDAKVIALDGSRQFLTDGYTVIYRSPTSIEATTISAQK